MVLHDSISILPSSPNRKCLLTKPHVLTGLKSNRNLPNGSDSCRPSPHPFRLTATTTDRKRRVLRTKKPSAESGVSVIPRWEFLRFLETFWKAASPETERGKRFTQHHNESGFINDSCFSHQDSFYCTLSSSLYPRCICTHLLSCWWAAHPREPPPAALHTRAACQRASILHLLESRPLNLNLTIFLHGLRVVGR